MTTALRLAWLALPATLLAGCGPQSSCDPARDRSIFQVGGCVMGGGYQQRVDRLSAEAHRAEADRASA